MKRRRERKKGRVKKKERQKERNKPGAQGPACPKGWPGAWWGPAAPFCPGQGDVLGPGGISRKSCFKDF